VLAEEQIDDLLAAADHELSAYAARGGQAEFPVSAHLVTAVKGHQP
jgi:hypothetical protein